MTERRWKAALGASVLTGVLFAVVYNICNRLTGVRPDVGVWVFEWERYWPVVPSLIVPYWSIDAFFVVAPFFCRNRAEIGVYRRRIVFVILAAGLCFLLIPLRFAFPRPQVQGVFGAWFAVLYAFDLPFNLFPSLHITFRTLLAEVFARTSSGLSRWLLHVWFSVVGVSTLLTWQHHLVDVLGGFWLAAIAMQLYRFGEVTPARAAHPRLALYYALAAVACSQIARLSWPWSFVFVWPAFALGTASVVYAGFGNALYRKHEGRLTRMTKLLFAPLLAGQWLSWCYYRRKSAPWNEVAPSVWIGSLPSKENADEAIARGVTSVLDLTSEFSETPAFRTLRYCQIPVLDLTAPVPDELDRAVQFIANGSKDGVVYVHCKAGYSRSAAAVGAWLLSTCQAQTVAEVVARLEAARPGIVIRPEVRLALERYARALPRESALDRPPVHPSHSSH